MDHIDNNSDIFIQQYRNNDISSRYNEQYHPQEDIPEIRSSNIDYEHDENESTSFVYKKRIRTKFTQEQLDILETTFQQHRYPTVDIIDDLVEQLNLSTQKITVWFQNRRARLKKTQQKLNNQYSNEKDNQPHYDSGIHLDEDVSHDSCISPPVNSLLHLPPPPSMPTPSPYYLPNSHYPYYNSIWSNFQYPHPFPSPMINSVNMPYNLMNYNSTEIPSTPFVFQDMSNYQPQADYKEEL
ncbi:unnamed protein product [Adineta steineri]|uniref:Homeobox domain-containing protein n=1 Tax=Adineta steineri TaxID=433720 RepID=A0A813SYP8_9BILA|nr:unnamed protein product [Adineta steineri]